MTVAIILANGDQSKWEGHLGVAPHFIEIEGERILDRTVRQLLPHADVIISGPDDTYHLPGTSLFTPCPDPAHLDTDVLFSTRPLWNAEGRTLIVLGDVRFTDEAIDTIVGYDLGGWVFYGRREASEITGQNWGELFACAFWPEHIPTVAAAMDEVFAQRIAGRLWRGGHWELYRVLEGIDPLVHDVGPHFVEINDWTDDIDFPNVYEEFMRRWIAAQRVPSS